MIQQLNKEQAKLEAEKKLKKEENEKLKKAAIIKINKNKQEIAKSDVNTEVLTAAMQQPTQANKANIAAAKGKLSPNVANLVEEQNALTTVVNANPNQPISAEVQVRAEIATASEKAPLPIDEEIEWRRFFDYSSNTKNQNLYNILGMFNLHIGERNIKKIREIIEKIILYFETIDNHPYFIENPNAAPIKEEIKNKYEEIKKAVESEMKIKNKKINIEDEKIKGFFGKLKDNPFYFLKITKIRNMMSEYLTSKKEEIYKNNSNRNGILITENNKLLKDASNIKFFTQLKEKKSADGAPYEHVFDGVANYYGLKPSDELIKFMKKRVEDYKIEARIEATKEKDIDTLLDEYLLTFLNNITRKSKYNLGDKVRYEKNIIVHGNRINNYPIIDIDDDIYIHGTITKISQKMYSRWGRNEYYYDIKNDMKQMIKAYDDIEKKYNDVQFIYSSKENIKKENVREKTTEEDVREENISPITAGGRKFTKKRKINKKKKKTIQKYKKHFSKKHFSKKCHKTYRAKHFSKKCHKIPLRQPLKQPLKKVGPKYKPKL